MSWLLFAGTVAGCSDGVPASSEVESALSHEWGDVVSVEEVTRTDGIAYPGGDGSPERYAVEYSATLVSAGPVTFRVSSGLERALHEGAVIKGVYPGHAPDPQGLEVLLDMGTARWRTDESRPARIHGTVLFTRSESGWRPEEILAYLSEESLGQESMSPSGSSMTPATRPEQSSQAGAIGAVSTERCAQFAQANPLPTTTLLDRLRGRSPSIAAALPDSAFGVSTSEASEPIAFGSIAVLSTLEVCVGAEALSPSLADLPERRYGWEVHLSEPHSPTGLRVLSFREAEVGAQYMWIVHPDSARALSPELLRTYPLPSGEEYTKLAYIDPKSDISPDGRYVVFSRVLFAPVRGPILESHEPPTLIAVDLQAGRHHVIPLSGFLYDPNPGLGLARGEEVFGMRDEQHEWTAPDVMQLVLRMGVFRGGFIRGREYSYETVRELLPADSVALIQVDVARGTARRLGNPNY